MEAVGLLKGYLVQNCCTSKDRPTVEVDSQCEGLIVAFLNDESKEAILTNTKQMKLQFSSTGVLLNLLQVQLGAKLLLKMVSAFSVKVMGK